MVKKRAGVASVYPLPLVEQKKKKKKSKDIRSGNKGDIVLVFFSRWILNYTLLEIFLEFC